ncbi:uncharacterized protein LOC116303310 [Actinia tenebrosa]|uniref:Metalloendopeptidase n=1 Tax=Actinia tenebrosa TaxID=6105 RepID=A0A6P8IQJ4_ACTTE|nr:uncharacterized protein LOC116303310 [Actinia tenebrosa]
MASGVLLVGLFLLQVSLLNGSPLNGLSRGKSYQDDLEFKEKLRAVLEDVKDDDTHSRIMAVNEAHKKYQDEAQKKQPIDVEENIVETNMEQSVNNLFEGDIELTPEQQEMIRRTGSLNKRTAGQISVYSLWRNRLVPYMIASSLKSKRHLIREAVRIFERYTCLKFYELSSAPSNMNYLYIDRRAGCHSLIGKTYSKKHQVLSLGNGCHDIGTILHEMTHAIGFYHEQGRTDRDKYVRVLWENIIAGQEYNFERHDIGSVGSLGLPYDYESLMHYGKRTFTRNGENTLERIDNPNGKLGRTGGSFSSTDKVAINALYECTKYPAGYSGYSSWSEWFPCNWACQRTRQRYCIGARSEYLKKKLCPGSDEHGVELEYKKCAPSECGPINGGWSRWSPWSSCNAKCGQGTKTRDRKCTNPYPMRNGKKCPGKAKDTEECTAGKCKLAYYETQFEGNMGSWKSEGPGYLKWVLEDIWRRPGPKADHTNGNFRGGYLYLPTGPSSIFKGKAKFKNTFGWSDKPFCLTFYYLMDGPSVGTLSIVIRILMGNNDKSWTVFTASGSKGRQWHFGSAFINVINKNFEVSFEGSGNGRKEQGTIALDDLYYYTGRCPNTPTAKPTVPPCIDIEMKCKQWAYEGECARRPKFMTEFCRKSCVCSPVKCKDTNKKCSYWTGIGECKKNAGWMRKNCCVSCRKELSCTDKDQKKCSNWAKKNECTKNSGWMLKNCCKSCKKELACTDDNKNCSRWAGKGECSKNPSWMKKHCCKSCRKHG